MPETEHLDAVVIGASLRGLVTGHVLASLGYRAVILERLPRLGGADSSFVTAGGTRFDHGLHVLDAGRSPLATRLFTRMVDGAVHQVTLRRGMVLRGHLLPYAPSREELPPELAALLPPGVLVDDLADAPPTREALGRIYGPGYAALICDEVLPSYPSEYRHAAFGVEEWRLLTNLYPWFFPRARRAARPGDESRAFHDRLRQGIPQRILYPREGGFGGFAEGFRRHLEEHGVSVLTGVEDLELELEPGRRRIARVRGVGRCWSAEHYFWAGSWSGLCALLGLPCQNAATDRVMLGSFRFNRPPRSAYHEILVGDPEHPVNRIYFPARFRESEEPLLQVEFAVPRAGVWPDDPEHWRQAWLASLRRLGLLDNDHVVEEFDYRAFPLHFNGFGAEGEPLRDADPALLGPGSNIRPVVPSMANLNVNRYVPRAVSYVAAVLAGHDHLGHALEPDP
jgi:protoporphyrinogen oxidase